MEETKEHVPIQSTSLQVNLTQGLFAANGNRSPAPPAQPFKFITPEEANAAYSAQPILLWGTNNKFPYELDALSAKVGVLQKGLATLVEYAYGQGIFCYKELEDTGDGMRVQVVSDKAVTAFLEYSRIQQYLSAAFMHFFRYGIQYPVYMWSEDRKKIAQLRFYSPRDVRLEKANPNSGLHENIYISSKWNTGFVAGETLTEEQRKYTVKLPLLDDYNLLDALRYDEANQTFAQRITDFITDDPYGGAPWHSVYYNKWLDISAAVPQLKQRLFEWALTINYIIYIEDDYFTATFGKDWKKNLTPAEISTKMQELQESIERDLAGKDNAFKSLFAGMRTSVDGKQTKSIIIEAIDNKLREGSYIPDNLQANAEICAALGIDGNLFGATVMGDSAKQGSGSNIHESALNLKSKMRLVRDLILQPLTVIQQINGWDPELKFGFRDMIIKTTDGRMPQKGQEVTLS